MIITVDIPYYHNVAATVVDVKCLQLELNDMCNELEKERAHTDLVQKAIELLDARLVMYDDLVFQKENLKGFLQDMYKYAHSVNKNAMCYHEHQDWRDKVQTDHAKLKEPL